MRNELQPGEIIKDWLRQAGVTQTEMATRIHITQGAFSAQLNGHSPIPRVRLAQIIEELNPPQEEISKYLLAVARSKYDTPTLSAAGAAAMARADDFLDKQCDVLAKYSIDATEPRTRELLNIWSRLSAAQQYRLLAAASELVEGQEARPDREETQCAMNRRREHDC